jgi:aspartyl-tRNA(Asn)/glutamyl-tRNA(Gln) amidotransferase subunit A
MTADHGLLAGAEAWHVLRDVLEGPDYKKMDIRIWHDLTLARTATGDDVLSLLDGYERMRAQLAALLDTNALLAMPTTKNTAPPIADLEADWEEYTTQNWLALGNTNLGNILGVAAVTLPNGTNANNMPTGFMVCAPGGHDERLLAQSLAIESVLRS